MPKPEFTPKQAAYDTALGWLRMAYEGRTDDIRGYDETVRSELAYRKQVAKLHNRLLEQSKLDGLPLDENPTETVFARIG